MSEGGPHGRKEAERDYQYVVRLLERINAVQTPEEGDEILGELMDEYSFMAKVLDDARHAALTAKEITLDKWLREMHGLEGQLAELIEAAILLDRKIESLRKGKS